MPTVATHICVVGFDTQKHGKMTKNEKGAYISQKSSPVSKADLKTKRSSSFQKYNYWVGMVQY